MKDTLSIQVVHELSQSTGFGYTDHIYSLCINDRKLEEFNLKSAYERTPSKNNIRRETMKKVRRYYDLLGVDGLYESSAFEFLPVVTRKELNDLIVEWT